MELQESGDLAATYDDLGTRMVVLVASDTRKKFVVHERLLRHAAHRFFDVFRKDIDLILDQDHDADSNDVVAPIESEVDEGYDADTSDVVPQENTFYLDIDVDVIKFFVNYLYRGRLPSFMRQTHISKHTRGAIIHHRREVFIDNLFRVYFFGEKIEAFSFMNDVIDLIQDVLAASDSICGPSQAKFIYLFTGRGSKLRRLAMATAVWRLANREESRDSSKMTEFLGIKDAFAQVCQDEPDFGADYLEFITEHHDLFYEHRVDPRLRTGQNAIGICFFHTHQSTGDPRVPDAQPTHSLPDSYHDLPRVDFEE